MESYIPITWLKDYNFCPYSIYLHQVFAIGKEETFTAEPQQLGKTAHRFIDSGESTQEEIKGIYVFSEELMIYGKIDIYYPLKFLLQEFKRKVNKMYKGLYYQIWAQYFCLIEMGFTVKELNIVSIIDENIIPVDIPLKKEYNELLSQIELIINYNPSKDKFEVNQNKCRHCIYCTLCDKAFVDHVYS